MFILQNLDYSCNVVKYFSSLSVSMHWFMCVKGGVSLTVMVLSLLQSSQQRHLPPFFPKNSTGAAYPDMSGSITLNLNCVPISDCLIYPVFGLAWFRGDLKGLLSRTMSILISEMFISPRCLDHICSCLRTMFCMSSVLSNVTSSTIYAAFTVFKNTFPYYVVVDHRDFC